MIWIKKLKNYILGFIAGALNGLFGTGGGLVVVPLLEKNDIKAKQAHATSIAIILPLSIISAIVYATKGVSVELTPTIILICAGIVGTIIGSKLLKKIPNNLLRKIFSVVMIVSAIRLLLK